MRIELFGDEVESIRSFDPMTQASRRRLTGVDLLPASEFLPAEWVGAGSVTARRRCHRISCARMSRGWSRATSARRPRRGRRSSPPARRRTTSPRRRTSSSPTSTSCAALARDLDAQAADRRDGLVAAGEIPDDVARSRTTRPPRSQALAAARCRAARGGRRDATPATAPRRRCRAGPSAPERGSSSWRPAAARVVVTTDQASRVGELLEEAGRPAASVGRAARAAAAGDDRPRARLAVGRVEPRAERAAAAHGSRAVRRHPRPTPDQRQAGGHPRPHRQARSRATTSSTSTMASRATSG